MINLEDVIKKEGRFPVPCPECGRKRLYQWKHIADKIIRNGTLCKSCVHKGDKCYLYGKKLSQEEMERLRKLRVGVKHNDITKSKMSIAGKVRYLSAESRKETSELTKIAMHIPEVRKRHIEGLYHSKWIKVRTDKGQSEMINRWNKLGFNFEINYQVHTDTDLFYVDGYDKERNVVLEYDGKYHQKSYQRQKDLIRQQKIIDILRPKKFWRYNVVTKQCKNIIGD